MNQILNKAPELFRKDAGLFLSISFGIFLFVLFFEPFPLDHLDCNNRLLFVGGIAGIFFIFMIIFRMAFHVENAEPSDTREPILQNYLGGILLLMFIAVGTSFYVRYVGQIPLSIYLVVKIIVISMISPLAIWLYDSYKDLKVRNSILAGEVSEVRKKVDEYREDYQNNTIELTSENKDENLVLELAEIVLVKSSGNYVEVLYKENGMVKKQLIRNTLKNIENRLRPFSSFMRCHRTYIINTYYADRIYRKLSNNWVSIRGFTEPVPVSRQYLVKLREKI